MKGINASRTGVVTLDSQLTEVLPPILGRAERFGPSGCSIVPETVARTRHRVFWRAAEKPFSAGESLLTRAKGAWGYAWWPVRLKRYGKRSRTLSTPSCTTHSPVRAGSSGL